MASKVAIFYNSRFGLTKKIAETIGASLKAKNVVAGPIMNVSDALEPSKPKLDTSEFDAVIIGAPIYHDTHGPEIEKFLKTVDLSDSKFGFFSVSGAAAGLHKESLVKEAEYLAQIPRLTPDSRVPDYQRSFAGHIAYTKYPTPTKFLMKFRAFRNHGPTDTTRDHVMTDWDDVENWAGEIAADIVKE
eukprot:TRINITY_DN10312_c0_g1_i2.p1 TRINITY_DN10312_c0_g1~~TRINITY_DN10312_c0_g1_i2.p1  ORF type:complete len:188 (-),score=43.45 TRINITY_DN10312_c0_g1_i2:65-628(-)